ncbi:shikimate dehydrogenase [Kaistia dalseonensis]|uniref:Shikimate dehydrogenase n=1 Tax=Kaistia dalseonensis TaxID=410840 RepID=A0ABU0H9Y4_9HYPH|nr:shikimate dehydrogenase [Kaistia dalseonensis]MCX5496510.1 shikimate dehydrogenase [Kaistia dalseonensis]MDQ0439132.1 shikimate dehydrogenase [Kaistia dalseonensis]
MQPVPTITGTTRFISLLGHPTDQVQSPKPVNAWFVSHQVDAVMIAVDILADGVSHFLEAMRRTENCAGISVTMPHKQAAYAHADRLTDRARLAGAVNIMRRDADGALTGDMVDGQAMIMALTAHGVAVADKVALVVGAGGAGAAISHALAEAGARALVLIERDGARLKGLRRQIATRYPEIPIHDALPDGLSVNIAINASPVGMRAGDPYPFPLSRLSNAQIIADAVTKPSVTPWLQEAQRLGLKTQAGAAMTLAQLPTQLEFWGIRPGSTIDPA